MAATMTTLSGSSIAAPAHRLSSASAFGSISEVQQLGIHVRAFAKPCRVVAARASSTIDQDGSWKKPQMLVALVAAGAALALNAASLSPAQADFPGNEGTGTKVGENSSVRGAASSGTSVGEGSQSGSGVEAAKDAVEAAIDINIDPLKTKIGDISPLKSTLNPQAEAADGKSAAMDVMADVKSKLFGGN